MPCLAMKKWHRWGSILVIRPLHSKPAVFRSAVVLCLVAILNVAALAIMIATEADLVAKAAFVLAWALLNFIWLTVLRRPAPAALLALVIVIALIMLSRFKYDKLWMTMDFLDLMIVDQATSAFLLKLFPSLRMPIALVVIGIAVLLAVAWRLDPFRVRLRVSASNSTLCIGALIALAFSFPTNLDEDFYRQNYVSKFARTGVEAIREYISHRYFEVDASITESFKLDALPACNWSHKPPHIILLHDESSFDITAAPGMKVPPDYHRHFRSFDKKSRKIFVEGASGPSWFTEYNVLTGLSVRSYGRFATAVTRIAAGRVARGLPHSLRRCGYKTFSLYPFYGAFLNSRAFQMTVGVERYLDMVDLGTLDFEADGYYLHQATNIIARERANGPLFLYVYTVANHFPWNARLRGELTPEWRDLGNAPDVDEYIRRQVMTARDYSSWLDELGREFPTESFLILRYGDHQPAFGLRVIDPSLGPAGLTRRLEAFDPRYFTTYYAIDAVNFTPVDLSSALDFLDAPYLPLVIQEAAGVPLDPTFIEQKAILERCQGLFFSCAHGAEVRRFNRMLINAGLIKGL